MCIGTLKTWYYSKKKHRLSKLNALDKSLFYHKAYNLALNLKKEHPEWGHKRISKELNNLLPIPLPITTVYYWITGRSKPSITYVKVIPELGYLTGVLVGDYRRTNGGLNVKNRSFAEYYAWAYEKVTGVKLRIHEKEDKRYGGMYFYTKENGGFMKALWKSGLWKTIAYIYPVQFLQGLFVSEGTISLTSSSLMLSFTTSNFRSS